MADNRYWKPEPDQNPYRNAVQEMFQVAYPGRGGTDAAGRMLDPTPASISMADLRHVAARVMPVKADDASGASAADGTAGDVMGPAVRSDSSQSPPSDQGISDHVGQMEIPGPYGDAPPVLPPDDPIEADDWQDFLRQSIIQSGGSEDLAEGVTFLVGVSPVGTFADVMSGYKAMETAIREGDPAGLGIAAGELGLEVTKVERVVDALKAASGKARGVIADAIPDAMADWMVKRMDTVDLPGEAVRESIARGLKNGFDPGEAMAYGVFSASAKTALNTAAEGILGKGKTLTREALAALTPAQKALYKDAFTSELAQMGSQYLTDVRKEAQGKMVALVAEEVFGTVNNR